MYNVNSFTVLIKYRSFTSWLFHFFCNRLRALHVRLLVRSRSRTCANLELTGQNSAAVSSRNLGLRQIPIPLRNTLKPTSPGGVCKPVFKLIPEAGHGLLNQSLEGALHSFIS